MWSKQFGGQMVTFGAALVVGSQLVGATIIKLDFGRHNNVDGHATVSPDANGNYWNNLSPTDGGVIPIDTTFGPFITTDNQPTTISLKTTSGVGNEIGYWEANGTRNGGLLVPSADLLGDFAVGTATEDYWFLNSPQAGQSSVTLDLTGLDPSKSYNFHIFGTRNTNELRTTRYTLTGANSATEILQTSGTGSASPTTPDYFGNNDTIVSINGITPTALGVIETRLETVNGNFSYLGIMEITEVPEPGSAATVIGSLSLSLLGRRRRHA